MQNAIYKICEKLRGYSWTTEYFEVLRACCGSEGYEVRVKYVNEDAKNAEAKNIVYLICEKLKQYPCDTECFEVLSVRPDKDNEYIIVVKLVNTEAENKTVADNDSNK